MPPSKRNELIDAATRVFYKYGFQATNLDMILEDANISRMTLYNHFESKDDLIIAALQKRDEDFRSRLTQFVQDHASNPTDAILTIFDFHENWFAEKSFRGCMFINATTEFTDPKSPARKIAAEHKEKIQSYIHKFCKQAKFADAKNFATQLNILLEGAIISAHVTDQVNNKNNSKSAIAKQAKKIATQLIQSKNKQSN